MTELLNREARFTVGDVIIHSTVELRAGAAVRQGLDAVFKVERDDTRKANTCELAIFNLNENNRGKMQRLGDDVPIIIEAGYQGSMGEIFQGTIEDARSTKDRVNWITAVEAADGGKALRSARINKSFPAPTTVGTVLQALADSIGLGISGASKTRLRAATLAIQDKLAAREFVEGTVLSGSAATHFSNILRSVGLDWSVQGTEIMVLEVGAALPGTPVRLASPTQTRAGTGLIGSPDVGKDGILKLRSLMNPELIPRRLIEVESRQVKKSLFKCSKCTYIGETAGQEWYVDIEARSA